MTARCPHGAEEDDVCGLCDIARETMPPASAPYRKLDNRRPGFTETLRWKPGFDDPDVPAAGGTEALIVDAKVTYVAPSPFPADVFLCAAPPHGNGESRLSLQCEETGTLLSLLLRHGWTPQQLVEKTKTGGLGRCAALFLTRCPRVTWS